MKSNKIHNSNFIDACNNAVNGIIYATTTQRNVIIQLLIATIVLILSLFLKLEKIEFLALTFSIVLVILMEMVNTAVETVVDLYVDCYHPKAKIAKDVAAGGVLIAAFNSVIVAYFLLFELIGQAGNTILENVKASETHLLFVSMVILVIAIIFIKAVGKKNKSKIFNDKFLPSGQSAIAFGILTAIVFTTNHIIIFILALIMALLIIGNRLEKNAKSIGEIIFGAGMGSLIILLIFVLINKI